MRTFNRELAAAKLNVLKTQAATIRTRISALELELNAVKAKEVAKVAEIQELEAKLSTELRVVA